MATFLLFVLSAGLLALVLLVLRASGRCESNQWFASFAACAAAWTFGIGGRQSGAALESWNDLVFASGVLLPTAFFGFASAFPSRTPWLPRWAVPVSVALGLLLAAIAAATPLVYYDAVVTSDGFARKSGRLYAVYAAYIVVIWTFALAILIAKWRAGRGIARIQLRYVAGAFLVSGVGAMTTNLFFPWLTGRSTYSSFGPYFGIVLIALIAHTIIRHRLMDLQLAVHRGLIVAIAAIAAFGSVTTLVLLTWPRLAERLHVGEDFVLIGAIVAAGLITPVARDRAAKLLDRYTYRTRVDSERTLRETSALLTRVRNVNELVLVLMRTLHDTIAPAGIAMYMAESSQLRHVVTECRESVRFDCPAELSPRLTWALANAKDAIAIDHPAGTRVDGRLYDELRKANWAVVLPFVAQGALIGAICLSPKLCGDPFYLQDLDLLMTVVNQAGLALNNAQRAAAICAR